MIKPLVFPFLPSQVERYQDERGWLVRPDSTESLQQVVRQAGVTHTALFPEWGMGRIPPQALLVDFGGLNQVVRLRPEELMVTAQTGIGFGALQNHLRQHGYILPRLTSDDRPLGDILAHLPLSLSETSQGPWVSSVTGIRAVVGDGESVHYGGEVVKNVTGYDLRHLFMGTHHQYGLMTQATLKMVPLPEAAHTLLFFTEPLADALQRFQQMGQQVHQSKVLTLFKTKTTFGWHILTHVSGYRQSVEEQVHRLVKLGAGLPENLQNLDAGDKTLSHWTHRLDWTHPNEPDGLVLRVALAPHHLLCLPQWFEEFPWLDAADVCLPWATGQLLLRWIAVNMPYPKDLEVFRQKIEAQGGFVQVLRLPSQYDMDPVRFNQDPQPAMIKLQEALQKRYNPHQVLPTMWPYGLPLMEGL